MILIIDKNVKIREKLSNLRLFKIFLFSIGRMKYEEKSKVKQLLKKITIIKILKNYD